MNNTLAHGLAVLGILSRTAESFGISELAVRLGRPKSHVHRLLQTLVEAGYAVRQDDRRYRIGLRPLEISCALLQNLPLRTAAMPLLHRLAMATGLDAFVAIPHQGAGLTVGVIHADGRQRDPTAAIGGTLREGTATWTLFSACIAGFAEPTLAARTLGQIRRTRFVLNDPGFTGPMNAMAALVGDPKRLVHGALGLAGPGPDLRRGCKRSAQLLRTAADRLSASISLPAPATATVTTSPSPGTP